MSGTIRVTTDEIIQDLCRVFSPLEASPSPRRYRELGGKYGANTISDIIGSWGCALYLWRSQCLEVKRPGTPRTCLRCGKSFLSEGAHHRLCTRCREGSLTEPSNAKTYKIMGWKERAG